MEGPETITDMKNRLQELNKDISMKQADIKKTLEESGKCKKEYILKSELISLMSNLTKKIKQSKLNENHSKDAFKAFLRNTEYENQAFIDELQSLNSEIKQTHYSISQAMTHKDQLQKESAELNYQITSIKTNISALEKTSAEENEKSKVLDHELKMLTDQQKTLYQEFSQLDYLISDFDEKIKKIPKSTSKPQPKVFIKSIDSDSLPSPSFLPKTSVRIDKNFSSSAETEDESIGEQPKNISKSVRLDELRRKKRFLINENESLKNEILAIKNANSSLVIWNESFEEAAKGLALKYFSISFVVCLILLCALN